MIMKVLTEADSIIEKILGKQEYEEGASYRLLSWCAFIYAGEDTLLHNYMTGKTVYVCDGEYHAENCPLSGFSSGLLKELVSDWFMVPEDTDDVRLLEELRSAMKLFDNKKGVNSYKILTTTDCNARCFYCYEAGIKKENMSDETAGKTVDFIEKNKGDGKVTLSWFGGEPMMNTRVMDIICDGLKEKGIEYASVMTSNGYLFDPDLIKKAVDKWHLKNIQITLDGTEDIYNKVKAYKDADRNPYERVIGNIEDLAYAGVRVNIRLNMGVDNFEDTMMLIDELVRLFSEDQNISAYVSGLFQETEKKDACLKKDLSGKLIAAGKKLAVIGLDRGRIKNLHTRTGGCMADNDDHLGISPSGALMKCEHHIYDRLAGSLNEGIDVAAADLWKKRMQEGKLCGSCPVRPVCYRIEGCPVSHPCDESEQREYILRKESQIIKNHEFINRKGTKNVDLTEVSGDEIC